jgi:hypothetical protein
MVSQCNGDVRELDFQRKSCVQVRTGQHEEDGNPLCHIDATGWRACHLVKPTGRVIQSFGPRLSRLLRASDVPRAVFEVWCIETLSPFAITADRRIWTFHPNRYELQEWTERGHVTTLVRDVPWYRPITVDNIDYRPYRYPTGLAMDSKGRLWTTIAVPLITDWGKPAVPFRAAGEGVDTTSYDEKFYTIIEVIDPASGRLIVSQRVPGISSGFTDEHFLMMHRTDENGVDFVDVYEVSLE